MRLSLLLILFLVPAYIIRTDFLPIPTNFLEILVGILLLAQIIKSPRSLIVMFQQFIRPLLWPLLLIFLGLIMGVFVAPETLVAAGIVKGWFVVPIILYCLLALNLTREDLTSAVFSLLLSTLPISLFAIWQVITGNFITDDGRASAWFASANYLTLYVVPITLLSVSLWRWIKDRKILILIWLLNLFAIYFTFSFGGWLALLGAVVMGAVWYRFDLFKRWLIPGALAGALGATLLYFTNERFATMLDLAQRSSASIRLQVWAASLLMIKEHFLTGMGPGSFKFNYQEYVLRLFNPPIEYAILHPHNLVFQILISTGLAGLVGFVWLFYLYFKQIVTKNPMTLGLFLAMAAVLVHGLVDTPYFKNDLSTLFWILVAFNTIQANGYKKT